MNKKIFITITFGILIAVIIGIAISGTGYLKGPAPETGGIGIRTIDSFHTGTAARWIMDSSLFAGKNLPELQDVYERWKKHDPDGFLTYAYIDKCADIGDNGDLIPRKECPHSWYVDDKRLVMILRDLYDRGYTPILKIQIGNFETVSEKGAKNFLLWLSKQTRGKEIVFIINGEFNFPPEIKGWGYGREGGRTNKIEPEDYNRQIAMWVKARDDLGLKNIYLGCQANILQRPRPGSRWSQYWKPERFIEPYLPGIRLLDVIGASHYRDMEDLDLSWKLTEEFYDMVGQPGKPFFFIEYAPSSPWKHDNIVTPDFVNKSYKMLNKYKFVKAIDFYFGPYFTDETIEAIRENALKYEGG